MLKTAISGTIQRIKPERQTRQKKKTITKTRQSSVQMPQRPWGTATVTRWGLFFCVNHFVAWCLKRWGSSKTGRSGIL